MKMSEVEAIAQDPGAYPGDIRREAFNWADSKRLDKSVSEEYRERAKNAFFAIYHWASKIANTKK